MMIMLFASLLLFTIFTSFSLAGITRESPLSIGQSLSSSNRVYELGFFSPNNSRNQYVGIWFKGIFPRVVVWVANREKPVKDSMANLTISSNGNLVLLDGKHDVVVWYAEQIPASNGSRAELLDDGNLIVIDNFSGRTLWESFEHNGDSLLPLSPLIYNPVTGERRVLTSWKSYTDPSPGNFVAQITPQVPSQLFIMKGSTPYYRTGPWAKTRDSKPSRVILTPEGSLKRSQHNGTDWERTYEAPADSCRFYGVCGPFGLCHVSVPITKCKCFKGFVPKYAEEWKRGNWSDGCVRRRILDCEQNSTSKDAKVFHPVPNVKPPDFHEFVSSVDVEDCHRSCFNNCSCLAFAYVRGIGCLIWSQQLMDVTRFSTGGELLFVRLARSELSGNNRKITAVACGVSLFIFAILGSAAFCFWRYRVKHDKGNKLSCKMFIYLFPFYLLTFAIYVSILGTPVSANISNKTSQDVWRNNMEPHDVSGLNFFEMSTIQTATDKFSLANKLGQGGFGSVYKGKLQDGKEIAVKRLSSGSGQGKEEFMSEILLISKLQHKNLVRILGCCVEGEERLLIYEFMLNKSLDTYLFDSRKRLEIDWPKRLSIIQGIARGLVYLHRDSCLRVIHRDLKVSNILLDEKMNPKISDFGLARMYQGTEYQDKTRRVVGTLGYMAPEYAWTGMFSEKSDIYSFGVLLLEIISGEKISRFSYGEEEKNLIAYAWDSWCETGGIDLLDREVVDSCRPLEVRRCVHIGLLCVQHQHVERPNTLELLSMLTTTTSDLPSPKQPTFSLRTKDDGPHANDLITINQTTQSSILGR
ncbi:unnamed protein product [Cochlearia groenlandica]